jgi:hypothetical protein
MLTSSALFVPGRGGRSRGRKFFQRLEACRHLLPAVVLACSAFVLQPAMAQAAPDEYPYCVSHLWAAGSQLGWAEGIARQDSRSEDARMLEYMRAAGQRVEQAHALCAERPSPWPAWPNWAEVQSQLMEMADKFRSGAMNRTQLAIALSEMYQSLATQLAFRMPGTRVERETSCEEIYMRLAGALGFAQTTTQIVHRLTPDAAVRLRKALSLIYQMREMPEPCSDFTGLIAMIGETLKSPNDPSIVEHVDNIWHAGEVAAAPRIK